MTEPAAGVDALRAARAEILERIAAACARVGRDPAGVQLVAVSKTVSAERLRDAVAAGLTDLGENRVQEGEAKRPALPGATWHLIGPLQSNKARRALSAFDMIQSVDGVELAQRLDRLAREVRAAGPASPYPILLQVNVDADPGKAGFAADDLPAALEAVAAPVPVTVPAPEALAKVTLVDVASQFCVDAGPAVASHWASAIAGLDIGATAEIVARGKMSSPSDTLALELIRINKERLVTCLRS